MSNESTTVDRVELASTTVDPIGEWFLIEDGEGTIVEYTDTIENKRAVLHDDFGTEYIVPTAYIGDQISRVNGRTDPRPPTDC